MASDVFGRALMDWTQGGRVPELVERDDSWIEDGAGPEGYLAHYRRWPPAERQAMRQVRGRVVDVGCGGGRVSLVLQDRGFDVVGLDASRLAVAASKGRGLRQVWCMPVDNLSRRVGSFDTILLFGNNFGIFGTAQKARQLLSDWSQRTKPTAKILVESTNPYGGGAPVIDRSYYRKNRQAGLLGGQCQIRLWYGNRSSDWFPWLFVSRAEMKDIVRGTGWRVASILGHGVSEPYVAVLERHRN